MHRGPLRSALERLAFTPAGSRGGGPLVGAEVEMLVADMATGAAAPIGVLSAAQAGESVAPECHRRAALATDQRRFSTPATLDWLRPLASREGWVESCTPKGAPCFRLADESTIGFEPGGQIEYSSAPQRSASALLWRVRDVVGLLHAAASEAGVVLLHVGIDPVNPIERVPLQLEQPRYLAMDAYLASRGDDGRRMMRQTAATQVAIDLGTAGEMLTRWRVLNAAVPYIVAAFGNSPRYAGRETGSRSHRAHVWRTLDASRTGIIGRGTDPIGEYLDFALAAPAMFLPDSASSHESFEDLARRGAVTEHAWEDHLSSLFPEVRPRGYFEVRSADAVPLEWLPALIGTVVGLVYDPRSTAAALDLLPEPDAGTLVTAGRAGLTDHRIARCTRDLLGIAVEGCARLGDDFLGPAHREEMRTIVAERTARGLSPASYFRCSSTTAAAMNAPPAIVETVSG